METRKLALLLITILNSAVEQIEEAVSEEGEAKEDKPAKASGGGRKRPETVKPTSTKKHGAKDDDDSDDDDDDKGDEPSEDDVVDAVRGAQKVLESADIKKILKKHGKAERASEVEPENRQAVIDALEKAVEDAE